MTLPVPARPHRRGRRRTPLLAGLLGALVAAALLGTTPASAAPAAPADTTAAACGTATGQATVKHVVWVVFENKSLDIFQKAPATSAPYLSRLTARCGSASAYSATPYYGAKLAMTSGSTWGSTGDVVRVPGPDLFSQLGADWTVYMGDMPGACGRKDTTTYFARHNPALWYDDNRSACLRRDLPLPADPSQLDLSQSFTWVEANVPDSGHGCSTRTLCPTSQQKRLALSDAWARTWVEGILDSPAYAAGDMAVFVVWDQAGANQAIAPFIVASPWTTPGYVSTTAFNHYSLLRGTQDLLGLPRLQNAATVTTSVAKDFGLG
ncbi:alkaline phosphatase family protein [Lapillicoccus jejuensis]|uniref:Phosphoesterase family protein n=1 Tax=Lapillicoccus jejuensis TaxID=402171 RepID=A0A542DVJ0_9MICO|nr:alkaline phosphatase family protein [Lapillicoccus jejuensis]TQJ07076.1 phosphoesterase family protein [Lapillicoccus jejuensis]